MRKTALAVIVTAGVAAAVLSGLPAVAATPGPVAAAAGHHEKVTGNARHARMGSYPASRFQAQAATLPKSLDAQLEKQLGLTPAQFLANGQAAADASKVVADLRARGVRVTDAKMNGPALTVSVADKADQGAVTAAGAAATVAPAPSPQTITARTATTPSDGTSPMQGGDAWYYWVGSKSYFQTCSVGFTGYEAGRAAFVTAGHCADYVHSGDDAPDDGKVYNADDETPAYYHQHAFPDTWQNTQAGQLNQPSFRFGNGADSGVIDITSTTAKIQHSVTTWGATNTSASSQGAQSSGASIPVLGAAAAVVGEPICHSGYRTGWQCGVVTSAGIHVNALTPAGSQTVDAINTTACILPGDSGGAYVSGNYAIGVASTTGSAEDASGVACTPGASSQAYPMVPAYSGQSAVSVTQPNFELGVSVPTAAAKLTVDAAGNPTGITGTLALADGTPGGAGTAVALSIDGAARSTMTSASDTSGNQMFQFALSGIPAGTHTYTLTVGSGHSAVQANGTFDAPVTPGTVSVAGAPQIDQALTATTAGSSPNAALAYRWVDRGTDGSGSTVISSATSRTFTPNAALLGHQLAVNVTATEHGAAVSRTSANTAPVATAPAIAGATVAGTAQVGKTLAASATGAKTGATLTYQWQASTDGASWSNIAGATSGTYTVPAAQLGKHIRVTVTATASGASDATVTSSATAAAAMGALTAGKVTISGTAAPGQTLTRATSGWQAGAAITYKWAAGTTTSTAKTFKVPAGAYSQKVTLTVTGTLTGYTSAAKSATVTTATYTGPAVSRLFGPDRYATAVAVSKNSYPTGGASTVVVASGENFPDALSAAPAAVKLGGPLLLTQRASVPSSITAEIKRLHPTRILIVGGPVAVSSGVQTTLTRLAPVTRVYGADRYATSLAVAKHAFGSSNVPAAFVATGSAFPDALSASAYAGAKRMPVLLVNGRGTGIPGALTSYLRAAHTTKVDIAGGTAVISGGVANSLKAATGHAATRFGGADRYATGQLINKQFTSATTAYLALGTNFPDALTGAAAAGKAGAPLYLVKSSCIPGAAISQFSIWKIAGAKALGGPAALGSGVISRNTCR